MGTLTNGPVQNKPFLFKTETSGTAQVQMVGLDDETIAAIGAASSGAGTAEERVLRTVEYVANASGTGYTSGDAIVRADVYDVTGATPSLIATIWFNATQAIAISAPTQANLTFVGTKDAATQTTLAQVQAAIGNQADTAATTDTGTFSLIALFKRLVSKIPGLGQAVSASSLPVVIASDQSNVNVAVASLPSGLATSANQTTGNSSLASIKTDLDTLVTNSPTLGQKAMAGSVPVALASDTALPLPSGAATAANQTTGNTSLAAINTALAHGQTTMAGSVPVALASDQSAVPFKEQQASTVTESTVAASATIATLLTASGTRRGFRIAVPSSFTGTLGLSTNNAQTLANCPIQLKGGDMWVESLAAASAWYVILDSSTATIPVQSIS